MFICYFRADNTWEPTSNIYCTDLIEDFETRRALKESMKRSDKKTVIKPNTKKLQDMELSSDSDTAGGGVQVHAAKKKKIEGKVQHRKSSGGGGVGAKQLGHGSVQSQAAKGSQQLHHGLPKVQTATSATAANKFVKPTQPAPLRTELDLNEFLRTHKLPTAVSVLNYLLLWVMFVILLKASFFNVNRMQKLDLIVVIKLTILLVQEELKEKFTF